jgi:NitT/TauT family transport system substrate-binding protein
MFAFWRRSCRPAQLALLALALSTQAALAETKVVRLAEQHGLHYLPMQIMIDQKLIEKRAAKAGIIDLQASMVKLGGGTAVNDALLSDSADFVAAGTGPLLKMWDRTKGNLDVRAIAGLVCLPMKLVTNRPELKSLDDLSEKDRIAVPGVKVSIQSVVLQMYAKKKYGDAGRFDPWTVNMKHPDAVAALLSGQSHISAHFSVPPFIQMATKDKSIRTVATSYEIVGGKHTQLSIFNTKKFKDDNPKVFRAVYDALEDAMRIIAKDKKAAAALYLKLSGSKEDLALIEETLNDPDLDFTTTPYKIMDFANFLHETGGIKNKPASWKDLYWETVHDLPGS